MGTVFRSLMATFLTHLLVAGPAEAQQVPDTTFRFQPASPAYATPGAEPVVCVDGGHRNFHTIDGRYAPFARLLEGDGYSVRGLGQPLEAESLRACAILVIANAGMIEAGSQPGYPYPDVFSRAEHDLLFRWVRTGGRLLLFVDHPPYPGAVSGIASLFGFQLFDGYAGASPDAATGSMVFGKMDEEVLRRTSEKYGIPHESFRRTFGDPGTLARHAIVAGRAPSESVERVVTFTGSAFFPSRDVEPLLVLESAATGVVVVGQNSREAATEEYPLFSLAGWLVRGVRRIAEGRVAVLAEAAMCSAQLAGNQRIPMGMNMPFASENAQFCLNVVHWLSGLLE